VEAEEIARAASAAYENGVSLADRLSVLLCNVMLSDAEARLLAYIRIGGSVEMTVCDIASLFGWSERKAYYVLAGMEEKGLLRRATRGSKK
jgi:predicted transcriptional regulator of viral defense system